MEDSSTVLFDKAELLDRVGDDEELIQELIELFIDDYPGKISGIEDGLAAQDAEKVRDSAHGLKGASANLSFNSVSGIAKTIEFAARDENLVLVAENLVLLKSEIARLLEIIS